MKKNLLLSLFFFCFYLGKAQWVSIPDANFAYYLQSQFSGCMNGNLLDTSCINALGPIGLNLYNDGINDLTGVQYLNNLVSLDCSWNQLTSLPPLPGTLTYLDCGYNRLTSLPALPAGITDIYCRSNLLTSLPPLPAALTHMACGSNLLNSLPPLPGGLFTLVCDHNQLTSLPALPGSLAYLNCGTNQLTSLPFLPINLITLDCYQNQLVSLPAFPNSLESLNCFGNFLFTLPALPNNLVQIIANSNQFTSLPDLPDSIDFISVAENPGLRCMPELKRIVELHFANTAIVCLPNYGNVTTSYPSVNSLPLCNVYNLYSCGSNLNISGKVYSDGNNNCVVDSPETAGITNIPVNLWRGSVLKERTLTFALGNYSFVPDSFDTYTISVDTPALPFQVVCPVNGVDTAVVTALDTLHFGKNFGLHCKPGFDLAAWSISGSRFLPGILTYVSIHVGSSSYFYGVNCSGGISGTVTSTLPGLVTYFSPAPGALTPDNVSGNTLTYNITDFGTVDFNNSFNILVQTNTTAPLGSTICFTVTVAPITGDDIPTNNIQTHCFVVTGSYDPNDKQVYPLSDVDVNGERWLTYTVNFQNTGTDTAFNIFITDTLDIDLDVSTFQLLAYSHQPLVQLKENVVRFNFPNIYLVDSNANEPLSHGYVQYKIKIKDGKPVGTVINNTAYIYFDFNAPVVTNTTTNTIAVVSGTEAISYEPLAFRIYPNPASSSVTLQMDKTFTGGAATISDVTGRRILMSNIEPRIMNIETNEIANGVYFVTVTDKKGRSTTKKLAIE